MRVRVGAIIQEKNKILMMKYLYGGTQVYNLPGGNLDFGENLRDGLARELEEELQTKSMIEKEPSLICETHVNQKDTLHVLYKVQLKGLPKINPKETSALGVEWVDVNALKSIAVYPSVFQEISFPLKGEVLFLGSIEQKWY